MKPKGVNMARKTMRDLYNSDAPEASIVLHGICKISVQLNAYDAAEDSEWVTLYASPKRKNLAKAKRPLYSDMASDSLQELGFGVVYNFRDEEYAALAAADIECAYDINKKPYTITSARVKDMIALDTLIKYSDVTFDVSRQYRDQQSGKSVVEQVPVAEFKQAIANYIKQNQK